MNGLPLDPRTRHGLAALADRPDNPDGRTDLISEHARVPESSEARHVAAVGYHADSERLEVLTLQGDVLAYRNVSPELARRLSGAAALDDVFRDALLATGHISTRTRSRRPPGESGAAARTVGSSPEPRTTAWATAPALPTSRLSLWPRCPSGRSS